jgi:pentapeptide MXKDX repeat protein
MVGDAMVGDAMVGDAMVGDAMVGDAMVGDAMVGDAMVGDAMVGDAMVEDAMVGDADTTVHPTAFSGPEPRDAVDHREATGLEDGLFEDGLFEDGLFEDGLFEDGLFQDAVPDRVAEEAPVGPDAGSAAIAPPAWETPAWETPAWETPAWETPAWETPAWEAPAGEAAVAGEPPAAAGEPSSPEDDLRQWGHHDPATAVVLPVDAPRAAVAWPVTEPGAAVPAMLPAAVAPSTEPMGAVWDAMSAPEPAHPTATPPIDRPFASDRPDAVADAVGGGTSQPASSIWSTVEPDDLDLAMAPVSHDGWKQKWTEGGEGFAASAPEGFDFGAASTDDLAPAGRRIAWHRFVTAAGLALIVAGVLFLVGGRKPTTAPTVTIAPVATVPTTAAPVVIDQQVNDDPLVVGDSPADPSAEAPAAEEPAVPVAPAAEATVAPTTRAPAEVPDDALVFGN